MIFQAKMAEIEFPRHSTERQCAECHWLNKSTGHGFLDYIVGFDPWFFA